MKKTFYIFCSFIILIFSTGCGTPVEETNSLTTSGSTIEDNLYTLNSPTFDLDKIVSQKKWSNMEIDLDQFYQTPFSTVKKPYRIEMEFKEQKVTAYADCQKLTASYKIADKTLSFSKLSYAPAVDVASCIESEDADQAVYQFFNHTYETIETSAKAVTFQANEVEAKVTLTR
ncbi:MAG: hypothetical protein K0U47_07340 [Epsilonproteobacteria bacterium]|nr:hypothetical protein [Campylobacterota bacterium]